MSKDRHYTKYEINNDVVVCRECNEDFKSILWKHLLKHNMTNTEYKKKYSDAKIRCPSYENMFRDMMIVNNPMDNEDSRTLVSDGLKRAWSRPEYRELKTQQTQDMWDSGFLEECVSNGMKQAWRDQPEVMKRGNIEFNRKLREDEDFREKISNIQKNTWNDFDIAYRRLNRNKPTGPERKFIRIIEINKIPLKYVGDGKFWIKDEDGNMNPDFVNDDNNAIIEIYGRYYHKQRIEHDKIREKRLAFCGYPCLIIYDDELPSRRELDRGIICKDLIEKINMFLEGVKLQ